MKKRKNPFYFLLGGLLITLLIAPIVGARFPAIGSSIFTVTLLVSVLGMSASKRLYIAAWALVAAKVLMDVVGRLHPVKEVFVAEIIVLFLFFVLAIVFAFRRVLEDESVDLNRIAGAISIYMLIGLLWTSFYFFLTLIDPQAFKGIPNLNTFDPMLLRTAYTDLLYFSYVTLSTLGYGDITPVSRAAQSFSYLEAISGIMYVAVLVSALVGAYGNKRIVRA